LPATHTSRIETENTKVSLPTLCQCAGGFENILTLRDCDKKEIWMIADVAKALKASLRKRL
jgi:hypothetical protein